MRRLNSNNIVKFHDVLITQNNLYIVQEFCNQGDLNDLLTKKLVFKEAQAKKILFDIV